MNKIPINHIMIIFFLLCTILVLTGLILVLISLIKKKEKMKYVGFSICFGGAVASLALCFIFPSIQRPVKTEINTEAMSENTGIKPKVFYIEYEERNALCPH